MRCEILNIGDELLNGTSVNTNATWMCGQVFQYGVEVVAVSIVGDGLEAILDAFDVASDRADLILVTGGLGPTSDDRTREATLKYFGGSLIPNQLEIERIRLLFDKRGIPLTERNIDQGYVPDNCKVLSNPVGTAPAMEFDRDGKRWVFMPGVPYEMKTIFGQNAPRWFTDRVGEGSFVVDEVMVLGVGESFVADKLAIWQLELPDNWLLAYLPSPGLVRIRLSCISDNSEKELKLMQARLAIVLEVFPDDAFPTGMLEWNEYFLKVLSEHKLTVATAESCTGGYLSHRITSVPGSSTIFDGGIVAYHNDIKKKFLDVTDDVLIRHGAVSREVVEVMAISARKRFNNDIGVAISGIAGPDGGTPTKPVGTMWVSVSVKNGVTSKQFLMGGDRIRNIERVSVMAMKMVLQEVAILRQTSL